MKRAIPWLVVLLAGVWLAAKWRVPGPSAGDFDTRSFGRLPVIVGGRVKPLDTVARNSLMIMRGKQTLWIPEDNPPPQTGFRALLEKFGLKLPSGTKITADRWLADVLFNPAKADGYPVFAIANPEVLGMFGWPQVDKRYCSYAELKRFLPKIEEEGQAASRLEAGERTPFQRAIFNLRNSLSLYQRLKNSLQPEGAVQFAAEVETFAKAVRDGAAAVKEGKPDPDKERHALLVSSATRYESMAGMAYMLAIPPATSDGRPDQWTSMAQALLRVDESGVLPPAVRAYAAMGDAVRGGDLGGFATAAEQYRAAVAGSQARAGQRAGYEFFFNQAEPFYHSMVLYVAVGLLTAVFWLSGSQTARHTAVALLLLVFAVHSFGMFSRMWLQERPPVTNLYSSAIFVGWGAVIIGLVLERVFRLGIGAACAAVVGFVTLLIAHHLAGSGDTMEMLQAVLDTNIWLATHVVVITFGYSAMFLAGMLAVVYVLLGLFTPWLKGQVALVLSRMVYGVICFATLFSFTGTVLGGIWADQSWGRFWGWDPKENGALLIVLWCALILHARWGGMIRQRGLVAMAIFGNAVTAFSWFGVNMLGVGLHSYGFMDKAFPWLLGFVIAQVVLVFATRLPRSLWVSFRNAEPRDAAAAGF